MTHEDKFILDATAGFRMMWFNKHHPNTIYLDQRPECEPDIVGDFRDLKDFPDESVRLAVFDPPHFLKKTDGVDSLLMIRFGKLNADNWRQDIQKGFAELWRVLKPYGVLIFKWSNFHISSDELLRLAPAKPLFYQISSSHYRKGERKKQKNGGDAVQTLWFCFMKIP